MGREKQDHSSVSYLGYSGLSKRRPGSLSSYFAHSYVFQLAICLLEVSVFEMNALAIKSLLT